MVLRFIDRFPQVCGAYLADFYLFDGLRPPGGRRGLSLRCAGVL
jgi:hypothetical protein